MRRLIGFARNQERHVGQDEVEMLWEDVELRAAVERKNLSRRRVRRIVLSAAAAAACICATFFGIRTHRGAETEPIAELVKYAEKADCPTDRIMLLTPGMDGIEFGDSDADIVYGTNGSVTVNTISLNRPSEGISRLIVPKGKRARLTLADGTHLWVNSASRVIFPGKFAGNHREIYVEGEVYMDVFHNEAAPFTVQAGDFLVKVLGTSFNVCAYPDEGRSSVILVNGKVNIADEEGNEVSMAPGQIVNMSPGKLGAPEKVDVEPYVCWVRNVLMCSNESLESVFRKLNLAYDREFVLGPGVGTLAVSGKLNLKDSLEDVLHTISFSAPIYYETVEEKIYVYKN